MENKKNLANVRISCRRTSSRTWAWSGSCLVQVLNTYQVSSPPGVRKSQYPNLAQIVVATETKSNVQMYKFKPLASDFDPEFIIRGVRSQKELRI